MGYKVSFLSLCEDFWEVIKDLCERFGLGCMSVLISVWRSTMFAVTLWYVGYLRWMCFIL